MASGTCLAPLPALLLCTALLLNVMEAGNVKKVVFHNYGDRDLKLFWVNHQKQASFITEIPPDMMNSQDTFVGHAFEIADSQNVNAARYLLRVQSSGDVRCRASQDKVRCKESWHDGPAEAYTGDHWNSIVKQAREECDRDLAEHPADAKHFCAPEPSRWHHIQCRFDFTDDEFRKKQDKSVKSGWGHCESQPPKFVNFTRVGYEVRSAQDILGKDLVDEVRSFWLQNRLRQSTPENHPVIDPALSGCESNTWMLHLPGNLKARIQSAFQPVLASWAGFTDKDELEPTAFYGLRLYRKGSVLNWHVDRHETHAVSAIIEFGHLGFGQPDSDWNQKEPAWPLKIIDHSGAEKEVSNSAGQVILYESATCPHGRPSPFPGREFANVFVHFRPKGWPSAYSSDRNGNKHEL